jgi:FkbM family methyltransferase
MFDRWAEHIAKAAEYFFTPFAYPGHFGELSGLILSNRPLARELVHLTGHRRWFEAQGFRTVIDVGGYIGAFSLALRILLPDAQIYAFEPIPENFRKLTANMDKRGRFQAFQSAIGNQTGTIDFNQSSFAPSSSILPMGDLHKQTFPHTAETTKITVPIARLDDFLGQMTLEPPVLLKLDVQGYEEQALLGATDLLRKVDVVQTEVSFQPLYEGQADFDRLNALMKTRGFEYSGGFDNLISPSDGSVLQTDVMFVRKTEPSEGGAA